LMRPSSLSNRSISSLGSAPSSCGMQRSMTYWAASLSSPSSFSRPASQESGIGITTYRDTSIVSQTTSRTLTSPGLHGLLLDSRQLALDRGQLLLEGLLGLSSTCSDSRSKSRDQDLTKSTWSQPTAAMRMNHLQRPRGRRPHLYPSARRPPASVSGRLHPCAPGAPWPP
jgi:hypothetical protein